MRKAKIRRRNSQYLAASLGPWVLISQRILRTLQQSHFKTRILLRRDELGKAVQLEMLDRINELGNARAHKETTFQVTSILQHERFPKLRTPSIELYLELEELIDYLDFTLEYLEHPDLDFSFGSHASTLEAGIWILEDIITLLKEREDL